MRHWVHVVWSVSSNYLNQFWVIAHYTPRNKSPWKWKLNQDISSSSPSAAYMRQGIGWALFHIVACRLFGAKALPKLMLTYCQLDPWEQTSVKLEPKIPSFSFMKMHLKRSSAKRGLFCPGGNELTFSLKDVIYRCLSWLLLELDAHIAYVIVIV